MKYVYNTIKRMNHFKKSYIFLLDAFQNFKHGSFWAPSLIIFWSKVSELSSSLRPMAKSKTFWLKYMFVLSLS